MFKNLIKKIFGEKLVLMYHYVVAQVACTLYRNPSKKLTVIGVTGTKGKTTTSNYIWATLNAGGIKTGLLSTVQFGIADKLELNDKHMTMPGRFFIQRKLHEMVQAGCTHAVVETPSEGIKQHRASCIDYSIALFTNLSPEHLPSHGGSFENYKQAKGKLFKYLSKHSGETTILANADSEHAAYYLSFPASHKITYALDSPADYRASNIEEKHSSVTFTVNEEEYEVHSPGRFNVYNALPAIIIARKFGVNSENINKGFTTIGTVPGRMEEMVTNNKQDFRVFVDYAHEKSSMHAALKASRVLAKENKVIVLLGAEGGGRDKRKRTEMGKATAELADYVIVSNVDPYDDPAMEIIEDIATAAEAGGKKRDEDLFTIEDRREGIKKALELTRAGDIVLITGKGAEQSMLIKGEETPWDDRKITKELLLEIQK